jgi:hypothetical protein
MRSTVSPASGTVIKPYAAAVAVCTLRVRRSQNWSAARRDCRGHRPPEGTDHRRESLGIDGRTVAVAFDLRSGLAEPAEAVQ